MLAASLKYGKGRLILLMSDKGHGELSWNDTAL